MLDRLFLKYLTKKGKIAYFVGQLVLFAIWGFIVLGIMDFSLESGRSTFIGGAIVILLIWGGICLALWKEKPLEEDNDK